MGTPGTRLHSITWVAKSQTDARESSSKAAHVATCMVLQLRLVNASVIHLI
jgi:cell division inhibitor SulA